MTTMISAHFHPIVGMAHDNRSGFYDHQQVVIDVDQTHCTVANVHVDAGMPKEPIRRFIAVESIERLPFSGRIGPFNCWCPAKVAEGIVRFFDEKNFPLPEDFHDYLRGIRNVEHLKREGEG